MKKKIFASVLLQGTYLQGFMDMWSQKWGNAKLLQLIIWPKKICQDFNKNNGLNVQSTLWL